MEKNNLNSHEEVEDEMHADKEVKVQLEKKLTLFNGITIIVGCIIGSGIFVSPKGVLQEVGSIGASLIIWTFCGLFSLIGSYCYAELGTMIRDSGADYAYIYRAFGGFPAFLRLWIECIIVRPIIITIVSLAFAKYVVYPFFPECTSPRIAEQFLAAACILILTFINCMSVRLATIVQNVFTIGKCSALVLIILTGIVQICTGRVESFTPEVLWEGTTTDVTKIALSCYSGLFAYNGWHYLNNMIEEMKNPKRDLPLAICISCIFCTAIYVLTIIAYHSTVTVPEMLYTPAVAVLFAKKTYGIYWWWIIPVFVSMSTFGTVNGLLFTSSRLTYVAGRKGHMPKIMNMVQSTRATPVPAVIFTSVISLLGLLSTDIYILINYMGFVNWLAIGMSVVILLYLRRKEPNAERPIKVWIGFPIIYVTFTAVILSFAFYASPRESILGILIILTGVPVYLVCVVWKDKPKKFIRLIDGFTKVSQKLFLILPEEN